MKLFRSGERRIYGRVLVSSTGSIEPRGRASRSADPDLAVSMPWTCLDRAEMGPFAQQYFFRVTAGMPASSGTSSA